MTPTWTFPFGQPVRRVVQTDRAPKRVFVLGVYASAVHACWKEPNNKTIVKALAVASEPYIFWRGDNAEAIIQQITMPQELGKLSPANRQYNGPSGIALNELILKPLGLGCTDVWLCDLVPHSCVNELQKAAINRTYSGIAESHGLARHTVPPVPLPLTDEIRRREILDELHESGASTLILLGDKPIKWFLRYFDDRWKRLADFGRENESYGRLQRTCIDGKEIAVLPLAHPRQIAKLGRSSVIWYNLHQAWVGNYAGKVLKS